LQSALIGTPQVLALIDVDREISSNCDQNLLMSMAKIFMIGFEFRGINYASNVFYQVRQNIPTYHLKLVNTNLPNPFTGTLILEKKGTDFTINSPAGFDNKELLEILVDALKKQEMA
jgi:hypothetical protein